MNNSSQGRLRHLVRWCVLPVAAATLAACGGGSGSSANADRVATFIDAHVAGLEFRSSKRSGVTDANGNFPYQDGETITFSVGNLVLGTVTPSGDKITPLDLVPGATSSDARVIRMLQALQTLDGDANPENGIQITPSARDYARRLAAEVRLDDPGTRDEEVEVRLETKKFLTTAADARSHFENHREDASKAEKGYTGKTTSVTSAISTSVTASQPANTTGRLLASNCFQCHGTMGRGGFESIRGSEASEVIEYLTKTANKDIMAAHAQGYTRAQLNAIITYLQQ